MPSWLRTTPVAHRGLHDAAKGIIENSPTAFEAAVAAGYAIELDVHISADGEVMAFHDYHLDRLTDLTGKMGDRSASELKAIKLKGSSDTIPTLEDVLTLVKGRAPLLIEVKSFSREVGECEARIAALLDDYDGAFAVQSFNPYSMGWFAEHAPKFPRGQISQNYFKETNLKIAPFGKLALTTMMFNYISKPHFAAFDCNALPAFGPRRMRMMGKPVLTWTVKDPDTLRRVSPYVDNIIFEGFRPEEHGYEVASLA